MKKTYSVWLDADPNDSFEVLAGSVKEAALKALEELGWCLGEGQEIDEEVK